MKRISYAFACIGIVLGMAAATSAYAQNDHSYISGRGASGTCLLANPCQSFGDALAATNSGGTITCLDPGADGQGAGANSYTITKSVTIDCEGVSGHFESVSIQGSGLVVTLRGLSFTAAYAGEGQAYGIYINGGSTVSVEHCDIEGFTGTYGGIAILPGSGTAKVRVVDSAIKNNGYAYGGAGIFIAPGSGAQARVTIERTVIDNNTYGVFANGTGGTTLVEVKDSSIANSAINGVWAYTAAATTVIVLDQSASIDNGSGGVVATGNGAFVSLNGATVNWNGTGLSTSSGGIIVSYQNNQIGGNVNAGVTPVNSALK